MRFSEETLHHWLTVAADLSPRLYHSEIAPRSLVRPVRDAQAFQGWRMVFESDLGLLYQKPLQGGDSVIVDFGEHLVGYLQFAIDLVGKSMGGPLRLLLVLGEMPAEVCQSFDPFSGTLSRAWLQDEIINIDTLPQTVHLPRRYAFRYLKIKVLAISFDYQIRLGDIRCRTVSSAIPGSAGESPSLIPASLRSLDRVSLRTLRNGMHSTFEDGPKRDRRLWLGDFPLQAQTNYVSYRQYRLVKRCFYLFAGLIHEDGRLPACLYTEPQPHKGEEFIIDFAVLFAAYLSDYAQASGDWDTVAELWPVAIRQLNLALAHVGEDGLYRNPAGWWLFIDWQPQLHKDAAFQGLLIYALRKALALARALGKKTEVDFIPALIRRLSQAARQTFFDPGVSPLCISGPQKQVSWASQVWMIRSGVIPRSKAAAIFQCLSRHPGALKPTTPYIYHYAVDTMMQCNLKAAATELLQFYWGGMISHGATTFWEIYDPDDPFCSPYGNYLLNSYCHSWSCTPAYHIRKYLL